MKEQREKIRQQYREEKGFIKKDSSGTRKGYCRSGNRGISGSGGSGSSTTTEAYISTAFYLNPTWSGFDGFCAIGRYPWFDDSGINEKYDKMTYIDVRYTTSNVTSFEEFDTAFETTPSYYSRGAIDQFSTVYPVPDYWHWTPELESGKSYTQLIRIHLCNADRTRYTWLRFWSNRVNLTTLPQPTLSFANNQFSISNQSSGTTRCIEFYRSNYSPYSSFLTSTERDICYNCCVRNQEWGLYNGQVRQTTYFALWDVGTYKVKLIYVSPTI